MKSPFAVFRKHQKVLMVVLTGLAMFAFIVLDSLVQNVEAFPPVFGLMLGIAIAWAITRKGQHAWIWMLLGGFVGGYLGIQLQNTSTASTAIVSTSFGSLREQDLEQVHQRRELVNSFIYQAFQRAHEGDEETPQFMLQQYMFGGQGDPLREAMMHMLLTREARQMGLAISRDQVMAFIDQVTSNRLSSRAFGRIVAQLGVSGDEMLDLIEEQLLAREVERYLVPANIVPPGDYWDAYRKVNMRQELSLVPIAIEAFRKKVGSPDDAQLRELFEQYKDKFPNEAEPGAPGFRQPGRIKIGYLEIDYDTVEQTIPAISDEEVEAYYEANKDEFRNERTPEFPHGIGPEGMTPGAPDAATPGPTLNLPELPGSEPEPTPTQPETKPEPKPEAGDKPESPPAPEPTEPKSADEPKSTPQPESPPTNGAGSDNTPSEPTSAPPSEPTSGLSAPFGRAFARVNDRTNGEDPQPQADTKPEPTAEPQPSESTPKEDNPEAKPTEEKPTEEKPAEEKPKEDKPAADQPTEDKPAEPTPPVEEEPLPEFKPLDEALKASIRARLLGTKTRARMQELAQQARGAMIGINAKISDASSKITRKDQRPTEKQRKEFEKIRQQIVQETQEYAREQGLRYVETPFLSAEELESSEDHPIGSGTEPAENPFERTEKLTVVEQHFGVSDFESLERQRYRLFDAEDPSTLNRFVHWQIDFRRPHLPAWDDEKVQEQVREAWITQQARQLAEQRAEEIAEILRGTEDPEKTWADTLEGVTETGGEGERTLVVAYTGEFTWLTRSSAPQTNPFMPPPMEVTSLPIILGGANNTFMRRVFNELNEGDIGTAWSADFRYIYVVRPENRTNLEELRTDFLGPQTNLFAFFSPYARLATADSQQVTRQWVEDLYQRYQVKWKDEEE